MKADANDASTASALLRETLLDPLDARVLLCHILAWPRTALITRADDQVAPDAVARFRAVAQRRLAGEPIAQLVGEREFYGRAFAVTPDVLIPRPDTELIVELALAAIDRASLATNGETLRVLDLGTGSGAIALSLALERPRVQLFATDRSRAALDVAQRNAQTLFTAAKRPLSMAFFCGDWFEALPTEPPDRFALIVSNPPYIAVDDPHLQQGDLRFEPRGALTDEADGLAAIRLIISGAWRWLQADAPLMIEHGFDQGDAVRRLMQAHGYTRVQTHRDLAGHERVTCASAST